LPEAVFQETFARLTGADPRFHGALAVLDGGPVGLVHYIFAESCWKPEGQVYLQDIYVDAATRGHGIGRALI
jgi:GNAT superfamily N-acetyltransferase